MSNSAAAIAGKKGRLRDTAQLVVIALVVAGVAAAFVAPWFARKNVSGTMLERYAPMHDGAARLMVTYDSAGKVKSWQSGNDRVVPPGLAVASELRPEERAALGRFLQRPGEKDPADESKIIERLREAGTLYQTRSATLEADGQLSQSSYLSYRDERGDFLLSVHNEAQAVDLVFEPPLRALSGLGAGSSWESKGQRLIGRNGIDYAFEGHVVGREELKNEAGEFRDCLKVETKMRLFTKEKTLFENRTLYWFAAGIGAVEWRNFDAAGKLTERTVLVSGLEDYVPAALPPGPKISAVAPPKPQSPAPASNLQLTRFAPGRPGVEGASASIPPTYIDATEPLLLTSQGEELAALYVVGEKSGQLGWRFRTGGGIYGAPAWDPARGRIYFGSTDKRLYALDARGLFLWSFATGDNIATRPVVAGNVVVFGSEDRRIYGVDAETGRVKWKQYAGAAVVGSPVATGGLAIIGSDDGNAYALDPATGEQRWSFEGNDPIEAPLVAVGERMLVATRGGDLIALMAKTGKTEWTTKVGSLIAAAPAVASGRVFVVEGGRVRAVELESGKRLWQTPDESYTGTPAIYENSLVVAQTNGTVRRLDFAGQVLGEWSAAAGGAAEAGATFLFGPVAGRGALWLTDRQGVIRRWGPPPPARSR
jgi:outer membrane protein assembly factor BamB